MSFHRKTRFRLGVVTPLVAVAIALSGCSSASPDPGDSGASGELDTITPGVLVVAIEPYAPYTSIEDGRDVGLDAEILDAVAERLGLTIENQVTDFAGMLASVQSQRVDISIGGIAWTAERAEVGLFTDPPYYSPPAMAVHGDSGIETVSDLEGLTLGTITGYVWEKSIKAVPGATLNSYPDANGLFADVAADRVAVGFVDPLLISFTEQQRPDLGLKTQYLTAPTDEEVAATPDYAYFQSYMTGFYIPKQEPKLEAAVSKALREMYESGELADLITKYGGDPDQYLKPSSSMSEDRQAVDRPSDWVAPSI